MSKELNSKEKNEEKITEKLDLKEKTDNKNFQPFSYIEKKHISPILFSIDKNIKRNFQNRFKFQTLIFGILASRNDNINSILFQNTLSTIENSLPGLGKLGFDNNNILICLFFNEINSQNIFSKDDFNNINNDDDYIYYHYQYNIKKFKINDNSENSLPILLFAKNKNVFPIENLKFFYQHIISDLMINKDNIFTSIITNGTILLNNNNLYEMILGSYDEKMRNRIIVPSIETINQGLISKTQQYEFIHYNLYNLNYLDISYCVPINSFFNLIYMNKRLLSSICYYYNYIPKDVNLYYHDLNLGIILYSQNYNIFYVSSITANIPQTNIEYSDFLFNYTQKYSGHYGNFFHFLKLFLYCNNCNIIQKLFQCFYILGCLFEFIFPSLAVLVIYSIFFEAFEISDGRSAGFFTILFFVFMIISGSTYLINRDSRKIKITNYLLYFIFEVYFILLIICSIIAMDNLRINKKHDKYKFNTATLVFLLILNIIPPLIPLILGIERVFKNILGMLLYIVLGISSTNSNFYMNYILNSSDAGGGFNKSDKKGILILIFYLFNTFFACLSFFLTSRSRRVGCVLTLTAILSVYNFVKMAGISFRILFVESKIIEFISEKSKIEKIKNDNNNYKLKNAKHKENHSSENDKITKNSNNDSNEENEHQTNDEIYINDNEGNNDKKEEFYKNDDNSKINDEKEINNSENIENKYDNDNDNEF